ncbi:sensor histidine kinase [Microbacterium sp. NPDC090225]|uniref:sensor histidine kinase n=1 Tax=Microbacterium sp. NPDC090225 TaxID=3364207 RepID=UPI0037FB6554
MKVTTERARAGGMLRDGSPGPPLRRWLTASRTALFSGIIFAVMWLTVSTQGDLRAWQLVWGMTAMLGAVLSAWVPLVGVFVAGTATAVAWSFGVTADPFFLAGIGVFALAESHGSRRFPWWLLLSWTGLAVISLVLGSPPDAQGFEDWMRGALLSAIVLAAAWVLGARTREARLAAAARARTEERLRLARDVHDVLSHSLGTIGVQAGVAAHVTALAEVELRATLQAVESQARRSLTELNKLLRSERSGSTETSAASLPLTHLLRETARTAERSGLDVELGSTGDLDSLPADVRTTAHRIVQEAVTNAIRHADAKTLRVSATVRAEAVEVLVRDDGIGAPEGAEEGHGLTGMRERVALAGGELSVESTSTGFTVSARLPIPGEDENEAQA